MSMGKLQVTEFKNVRTKMALSEGRTLNYTGSGIPDSKTMDGVSEESIILNTFEPTKWIPNERFKKC